MKPPGKAPRQRRRGGYGRDIRLLLNVIWFVFAGVWLFLGYLFAAIICFLLIVTIPFGVAALRIAFFGVWPFGRVVVPQADKGVGSSIGNVIWFLVAGWWLTLLHIVSGIALCLTIIGIPLGLANFKLITVGLRPFGREIMSVDEADRLGLAGAFAIGPAPRPR